MGKTTTEQEDDITSIFDVEMPLPTAEGQMFGVADDWHLNAYVYAGSWDAYAMSYKEAADQLVRDAVEERAQVDFLAFPVIYLYRQYLELRLKELALVGSRYLEVAPPDKLLETHNLMALWQSVCPLLEVVWRGEVEYRDIVKQRL